MDAERSLTYIKPLFLSTGIVLFFFLTTDKSQAAGYKFNPAFISDNTNIIADLSSFELGLEVQPGYYKVDIFVNNKYLKTDTLLFQVKNKENRSILSPCMSLAALSELGMNPVVLHKNKSNLSTECVDFSLWPEVTVVFDQQMMKVTFSIPQVLLNNKARGAIDPEQWESGITTAMLNYTFSGSDYHYRRSANSRQRNYFLGLNGGINWGAWRFRNQQNWIYNTQNGGEWSHINSYLQRDIRFLRSQITLGETNTSFNIFDSVGLRGIQLESKDSMLPDSLQGFAPTVRGIAKSNAKVTIRQNNNVIYQTFVAPGAFAIDDLYPTSASGDLNVEVAEENGQSTNYTVPYSSVPNLVREGHVKYALSAGHYRSGLKNEQNTPFYTQASLFWGTPWGLTLYGGMQLSERYTSTALGIARNMGAWGAVSLDMTHAESELSNNKKYRGNSLLFRYAKSVTDFGTNLNFAAYHYSTDGFYSLSDTTYKRMSGETVEYNTDANGNPVVNTTNSYNLRYAKKAMSQILLSQNLHGYGSAYFSFNHQNYWRSEKKATNMQIGYSGNIGNLSYTLSYAQNKNPWNAEKDKLVNLAVSLPISSLLTSAYTNTARINTSIMSSDKGDYNEIIGLSGNALDYNKLSYNIYQYRQRHSTDGGNIALNYKGRYGITDLGYSYSRESQFMKYGFTGAMALHENGLTLGQQLGNTNILVKAEGASDAELVNGTGIQTDGRGYAIIPYATAYRENRVQLREETLDPDVELDEAVKTVIPSEGALVRATFKARVGKKVMFRIVKDDHQSLPFGTIVSADESDGNISNGIIDDSGIVYISGLPDVGRLTARWGKKHEQVCTAEYDIRTVKNNNVAGIYSTSVRCK